MPLFMHSNFLKGIKNVTLVGIKSVFSMGQAYIDRPVFLDARGQCTSSTRLLDSCKECNREGVDVGVGVFALEDLVPDSEFVDLFYNYFYDESPLGQDLKKQILISLN